MATALTESPDVKREVVTDRFAKPLSVPPPPPEVYRPQRDITVLSVIRFVAGAIAGIISLAIQILVGAILLNPFTPFFVLPLMAFLVITLVALVIAAGGAVLTALGLV
jgi:hypothetical protein